MCKVLLVEDDPNLGDVLRDYLDIKGFKTTLCRDGVEGGEMFKVNNYDICILDLMMPKKDGFTLAQEIREQDKEIPIVFLTAKSMNQDVIKGLEMGADDYVTKPFSMEELQLRIRNILKRVGSNNKEDLDFKRVGLLDFNFKERILKTPQKDIKLTTKENDMLKIFVANLNKTVTRSKMLNKVWKSNTYFNARSMDVYITKLRKYISFDPNVKILTIHREGFKMVLITKEAEES